MEARALTSKPNSGQVAAPAAVIAVLLVAAIVGVAIHHPRRSGTAAAATPPRATTATTTANGSIVLSDPVDLLTLAIPAGWTVLPNGPLVLPGLLRQLATKDPQFAGLLNGEVTAATEGGIRLFAYTMSPSMAYASILSYSSPGTPEITEASAAPYAAYNRRTPSVIVETSTVAVPAGLGLRLRGVSVQSGVHLAFENLALLIAGRTVVLQLAANVSSLSFPAAFPQIEASLRPG